MVPASAADCAPPQQFTSMINASGRVRATASARSATSYSARLLNTTADFFSAAIGFVACQSSSSIRSTCGSIEAVVNPNRCPPMSTALDSVRR